MFFYASKIFWIFAEPISVITLLLVVSVAAGFVGWRRTSFVAVVAGLAVLIVCGWTTAGSLLLGALEDRFSRPVPPQRVDGIVVLGGVFDKGVFSGRGIPELSGAGDRMTEGAMLALRYPDAKLVISGGAATLMTQGVGDAEVAGSFFERLGIARSRLLLENRSRNTEENAKFSFEIVRPAAGENWLLVTSAFHMPRSVGLFRKAGFDVVAWPADYRTAGNEGIGLCPESALNCLDNSTVAIREWIGLVAYWLTGKIDSPFPAPRSSVQEQP